MLKSLQYSIGAIRDEARELVERGSLDRHQCLFALCKFFPEREWESVERELELNQYLLRDCIFDLVTNEEWATD